MRYATLLMPSCPLNLPDDFPLRMLHDLAQEPIALHSHNFYELVVILAGSALHRTPQGAESIQVGTILTIPPGCVHGYDQIRDLRLTNLFFLPDALVQPWFRELAQLEGFGKLVPPVDPQSAISACMVSGSTLHELRHLLERLFREMACMQSGYAPLSKAIFTELIAAICRYSSISSSKRPYSASRIVRAMRYIEQHYADAVTLEELAKLEGVSKSSLVRFFREATGMSPLEYLIHLRLQKAVGLFYVQSLNLTQIAFSVGFNDSNYFSRQFKKKFGVSPRNYRESVG